MKPLVLQFFHSVVDDLFDIHCVRKTGDYDWIPDLIGVGSHLFDGILHGLELGCGDIRDGFENFENVSMRQSSAKG